MRIYSWNVNGVRAAHKKGLIDWMAATRPDVLCLQETKADPAQLSKEIINPLDYHSHWAVSTIKKGYSGVATYHKNEGATWSAGLGIEEYDVEGRVLITDMGDFDLYNVYFPNGTSGSPRLAYKMAFYDAFLEHITARVSAGRPVIFCGDVNTAHKEHDLARPKENQKTSGFLPEERAVLDRWTEAGWLDSFRVLYPEQKEAYSWWDQRTRARDRNLGWRIDYFWVHQSLRDRIKDAGICADVLGSDHCPVWLELHE